MIGDAKMTINNVQGVRSDISEMLAKIREVSNKSEIFSKTNTIEEPSNFHDAFSMAKDALSKVSQTQIDSDQLKTAYATGDGNVSIAQVIVASQKSKLALEGLISVRNKILDAYKEIMSMPV